MEESILTSIKKLLGITEDYEYFDEDIKIHINSIFATLYQLGVGQKDQAFKITGKTETWDMFIQDEKNIDSVKTYIYLKVRLIFDPPSNTSTADAFKAQADEYEWRLRAECDDTWLYDEEVTTNETTDD